MDQIEKDKYGIPVNYHILKTHSGSAEPDQKWQKGSKKSGGS